MDKAGDSASHHATRRVLQEFAGRARTLTRQPRLDEATVEALGALNAAGVDVLLLKGATLARMLYTPEERRGYFDIDFLVAPPQFEDAKRVLIGLGYADTSGRQGVDDLAGIQHAGVFARRVPGVGATVIDLHWRLDGCNASPQSVWDALRRRRTSVEIAGHQAPTLDRAGLALHLALHLAQHGPADLKAAGDLQRGLDRWPTAIWRQAAELSQQVDGLEAFAAGLRLVPAGVQLARDLELPTADRLLWSIAQRDVRPRGTFHMQAFAEAPSLRGRLDVLRRSALPNRAWVVWEHPWAAKGSVRLLLAYIAHLMRTPSWALRAWRFQREARRQTR